LMSGDVGEPSRLKGYMLERRGGVGEETD
jgi:hypothetical protein